jgi:hypothetical protein
MAKGPRGGARYMSPATRILHFHGVSARDVARQAGYRPETGGRIMAQSRFPEAPHRWARALRLLLPEDAAEQVITHLGFE